MIKINHYTCVIKGDNMKKFIAILLFMTVLPANALSVNAGRKIPVIYNGEKVTEKTVSSGEKIYAEIQSDIMVNNTVVFKQGDTVILNVADAKKARCFGNAGEILLFNGTIEDAKGIFHPIEYNYKITGEERICLKLWSGVSIFFLFPLALCGFVHGGQTELLQGKVINVTLMSDFNF